ncbi:MAG: hypothetical protein M0042_00745 [Nitrospiraceae bacterium]|nr:hypothetical protein [Nitrospiraceae bacterium]
MDTIMRIWVFACIILFTMRQVLPDLDKRFHIMEIVAAAFVVLILSAVGPAAFRAFKEVLQRRSFEKQV